MLSEKPDTKENDLIVNQWIPYEANDIVPDSDAALQCLINYLDRHNTNKLTAATKLLIAPGYQFKITQGIITNFHQPQSTLLLLVAAFVGEDWKRIYDYALQHDFRFLSYGDCSLLL